MIKQIKNIELLRGKIMRNRYRRSINGYRTMAIRLWKQVLLRKIWHENKEL